MAENVVVGMVVGLGAGVGGEVLYGGGIRGVAGIGVAAVSYVFKRAKRIRPAPKGLPPLRQAYISEVEALKNTAAQMRAAGKTPEEIARALHQARRDIGIKYKDLTPADKLAEIHARNLKEYGDKLGPTIDSLRDKGKTWEQIIESSSRTGGADLGLAK